MCQSTGTRDAVRSRNKVMTSDKAEGLIVTPSKPVKGEGIEEVESLPEIAKGYARLITPPVWRVLSGLSGSFAACETHGVFTVHGTK
jgi:hypothetical protein